MAVTAPASLLLLLTTLAAARPAAAEMPARVNPAFLQSISVSSAPARQYSPLSAPARAAAPARQTGFRPSPLDFSRLAGRNVSGLISRRMGVSAGGARASYAAAYDLRTNGKLPTVRNQGNFGDCWAFATYASMESGLLTGEVWDFSENNMAMNSGFDASDPMQAGGNTTMSTAYLARWGGPVTEAADPHDGVQRNGVPVQKHAQDILWLPAPAATNETAYKENIKSAIQTYGAVYASIYWDDAASDGTYTNFYNDRCTKPYGVSGAVCTCGAPGSCTGHAIALVGWNDNYPKTSFLSAPAGNGAFIARNSWGTGIGESGYFYISYYDKSLGGDNAVFTAAPVTNYTSVYQYDALGYSTDLGNGDTGGVHSTTEWMANIFTASAHGLIKAAGFYTTDVGVYYDLFVYRDVTAGAPRSGTLAYSASGSIPLPGYHTIPFNSGILVQSGQNFSIVVKLSNSSYRYPVAVERPYPDYTSAATASAGQSYFSPDGNSWTDMTSLWANSNVCLKAYADSDSSAPAAVATVNDGTGADIIKTGSTDRLSANWTASSDAESGVAAYYYAIGTLPGSVNVADWTSNGASLSVTRTGLTLQNGTAYYFGVKALNGVGLYSAQTWSNGQLADNTSPADVPYVYDGPAADIDYTSSLASISGNWGQSSFPGGSIDHYSYAIGVTPGGTTVTGGWINVGLANSAMRVVGLTEGTAYYFSVKATNNLGNDSAVATSDGQVPDATAPSARVLLTSVLPAANGALAGKLVLNEAADRLAAPPTLSFRTSTGQSSPLTLAFLTGSTWTLSGYVETYHSTGTATFVYSAADKAGNTGTSITAGNPFTINTVLSGISGGAVFNSDGNAVSLPAGAYPGSLYVSISTTASAAMASADLASPDSWKIQNSNLAREFTARNSAWAPVTTFSSTVTITLSYPDADNDGRIDMDLIKESTAWLYYLDTSAGKWLPVPGVRRNASANTLSAEVTHFSVYSVRSAGSSEAGLGSLRAFPNPCDFRTGLPLRMDGIPVDAAGTRVYIYNEAGELVRTLSHGNGVDSVGELNSVTWYGRQDDGSRAASGLYIYLVKTSNYGKGSGKFFIIW